MKKNKIDLEKIEEIFYGILIFLILILLIFPLIFPFTSENISFVENLEETDKFTENVAVDVVSTNDIDFPCDTENPTTHDTESIDVDEEIYAESILSAISGCNFLSSQQTNDTILYTVAISNFSDSIKLDLNAAGYSIKGICLKDSEIKHIIICAVKESRPETVVLMIKDNQTVIDNL